MGKELSNELSTSVNTATVENLYKLGRHQRIDEQDEKFDKVAGDRKRTDQKGS